MAVQKESLTDEQTAAIGQIVADNLGAHFQTGMMHSPHGVIPYLFWKFSPTDKARSVIIEKNGDVIFR